MKPDLITLQRFREMRDVALYAPLLTENEKRIYERWKAEQRDRDEAKRAREDGV